MRPCVKELITSIPNQPSKQSAALRFHIAFALVDFVDILFLCRCQFIPFQKVSTFLSVCVYIYRIWQTQTK